MSLMELKGNENSSELLNQLRKERDILKAREAELEDNFDDNSSSLKTLEFEFAELTNEGKDALSFTGVLKEPSDARIIEFRSLSNQSKIDENRFR